MRALPAVVVLLGIAVIGGVVGYRIGVAHASAGALIVPTPAVAVRGPSSVVRSPGPAAAAGPARLPSAESAETSVARNLTMLRMVLDLQKRNLANFNVALIDYDAKVTPAFRELFGLTDADVRTLQQAVTEVHDELDRRRKENSVVTVTSDAVVVKTTAFTGGADLYDQLMDRFATTLGPERYGTFVNLQERQMQWVFGQFGAQNESMTITRTAQNDGTSIFSVKDERKGVGNSSNGTGSFSTVADLVKFYPALAPCADQIALLPAKAKPPAESGTPSR